MYKIYMDVCCLNRPFDDQSQERVRLETEAVRLILLHCQRSHWQLVRSEVIELEIAGTPDVTRRDKALSLLSTAHDKVNVNDEIARRAVDLENLGFKAFDALHIACAESREADVMLSTDDRLVRTAKRHGQLLEVRCENPLVWLVEVLTYEL